ncbi:periplasmic binding protein-like II [Piromyces finnis]|uniref:Periplasmic binding protein-like II n=1 Tax=Piromyces finnis TaxID=1754191 RepID=A0A1Y1V5D5_9FUNG|nr:periplasmic binding protein-like II [Piromyces finnis]|eukprot:ORX46905.1 periplasmic binding protein-like II [Piromyces finnis]
MKLKLGLDFYIQLILISFTYSLKITSVIWTYDDGSFFKSITNDFNEYAKKNNLDIELEFVFFTTQNTTTNFVNEFDSTVDFLLSRKSDKYDVYFYDVQYSRKYFDYFIDLNDYLSKEHLAKYENDVAPQIGRYNGKWIGLPLYLNYEVLHSNIVLLEKYGLGIPKTWDQLLEYGEKVLEGEAKEGNTDLIGYNGLCSDTESCVCTVQELIHSFRETPQSPFPGYSSQEAIDSLNKFKEIMNKISTYEIFNSYDEFSIYGLFSQSFLFVKFWDLSLTIPEYKKTVLVGKNEGVSGTTIGGYNIGVCKYISEKRIQAAIKVVEFLTSEEYQKKLTTTRHVYSAMRSIYEDEEVCKSFDCETEKQFQPIARPSFETDDYDEFSYGFRRNVLQFLNGNLTAAEALNNVNDLIAYYSISINPKESSFGFVSLILTILFIIIMILSYTLIFKKDFKPKFAFLPKDFWFLIIFGSILYMSMSFLEYGTISDFKCRTKYIFRVFGLVFTYTPLLYRLVIISPIKTRLSIWLDSKRYVFLLAMVALNIILCGLSFTAPIKAVNFKVEHGKNFRVCSGDKSLITIVLILEEVAMFVTLSFYAFLEWHMARVIKDIRAIQSSIVVYMFLLLLLDIINSLNINSFNIYFITHWLLYTLISISNFILLFDIRFLWKLEEDDSELSNIRSTTLSSRTCSKSNNNITKNGSTPSLISKVVNCHYNAGMESNTSKNTPISTCNYSAGSHSQIVQSSQIQLQTPRNS